jgi:hypothetical protein
VTLVPAPDVGMAEQSSLRLSYALETCGNPGTRCPSRIARSTFAVPVSTAPHQVPPDGWLPSLTKRLSVDFHGNVFVDRGDALLLPSDAQLAETHVCLVERVRTGAPARRATSLRLRNHPCADDTQARACAG